MRGHVILSITAAMAIGACATTQATREAKAPQRAFVHHEATDAGNRPARRMAGMCPMRVKGVTAAYEDTKDGAAILFRTHAAVSALRSRVERMARMLNRHHGQASGMRRGMHARMHQGMNGGGKTTPSMANPARHEVMMMPASTARTEEVDHGVRLILTPVDIHRLAVLRQRVRQHVKRMESTGRCPMASK